MLKTFLCLHLIDALVDTVCINSCRLTRKKYSVEDFIDYWANPPFIPHKAIGVYLYLGHNFIFELAGKTEKEKSYHWTNADGEVKTYKSLSSAETKMCSFLFDKSN